MKPMLGHPESLGDLGRGSAVGSRGQGHGWEGAGPGEGPSLLSKMGERSPSVQPVHGRDPLPSQQDPPSAGQCGQRRGQAWPRAARPAPWVFSPGSCSCSLTAPHRASTQAGPPSPSDGASSPRGGGATKVTTDKHILGPPRPREAELVGAGGPAPPEGPLWRS